MRSISGESSPQHPHLTRRTLHDNRPYTGRCEVLRQERIQGHDQWSTSASWLLYLLFEDIPVRLRYIEKLLGNCTYRNRTTREESLRNILKGFGFNTREQRLYSVIVDEQGKKIRRPSEHRDLCPRFIPARVSSTKSWTQYILLTSELGMNSPLHTREETLCIDVGKFLRSHYRAIDAQMRSKALYESRPTCSRSYQTWP